jgi:hypothetical protein
MTTRDPVREQMKALLAAAFAALESRSHDTLGGLRQRYYYRGSFILLEHLTPKGLATNIARLRRLGEHEHAEKLQSWQASRENAALDRIAAEQAP